MRKSEVVKRQKEELDRFRELFALAVDDSDLIKDMKLKLDIMQKRHDMERKTWNITESKKENVQPTKKHKMSVELREKLDEIYKS